MKKIKSGIYGLNPLLDGGINEHSTTVVIGAAGAGKTTFATQFILRGLHDNQEGIFVSLDENKEQIIREAVEMGWTEILDYLDNDMLVFIDASGKDFSKFVRQELPSFVEEWEGANARIAIDPLTPVIWTTPDRYEQRELIGFLLKQMRKVGTVVCTLEEHGSAGDLSGNEIVIPMYLADSVIHLRYTHIGDKVTRKLKIIKCRSSRHSEEAHPYRIIKGLGIVVDNSGYVRKTTKRAPTNILDMLRERKIPPGVYEHIRKAMKELVDDDFKGIDIGRLIESIIEEYG